MYISMKTDEDKLQTALLTPVGAEKAWCRMTLMYCNTTLIALHVLCTLPSEQAHATSHAWPSAGALP